MGRTRNVWVGLACGAALGIGGIVAVDAATGPADAQGGFKVTPGQLQINQKISQAAVRRSNEALNLLGPLRDAPGQQANNQTLDQSGGVQPGTGTGWLPEQINIPALQSALGGSGQGATGPQGPPGPQGDQGGLSFGDGRQVPNQNDIECNIPTVVGTLPVELSETSRIWTHAHGSVRRDGAAVEEFALYLQLRDEADQVVAVSTSAWEAATFPGDTDAVYQLTTGGVMLAGTNPNALSAPFGAPAGTYQLELVMTTEAGACAPASLPDFGYNQGANMSYMPIGAG